MTGFLYALSPEASPLPAVPFRKMHGLGNDFVVLDARETPLALDAETLRRVADRRYGIGCDQVILLEPSARAQARMRIFNPDGGEVGACGNATRCVGALLAEETGSSEASIETQAGLLHAWVIEGEIAVDMGLPRREWAAIPLAGSGADTDRAPTPGWAVAAGLPASFSAVNMGNPHAVVFVETAVQTGELGARLERDPLFPERANVSFARVASRTRIELTVWERGAGLTLACGSAACATAVAAWAQDCVDDPVTIALPGGSLLLSRAPGGRVIMRGPASLSFVGTLDPSRLERAPA